MSAFTGFVDGVKTVLNIFRVGQVKDLLQEINTRDLVDGIAFLEDGRLEIGLELRLPGALAMPDFNLFVEHARSALRSTPPHTKLRLMTLVSESDSTFLDHYKGLVTATHPTAALLADARHDFYKDLWKRGYVLQWRTFVMVTVGSAKAKLQTTLQPTLKYSPKLLDKAKRIQHRLLKHFEQVGFHPKEMTTQAAYELCFRYYNPSLAKVNLGRYRSTYQIYPRKMIEGNDALRAPTFRSQVAKSTVNNSSSGHLKVGEDFIRCIAMHTIPDMTFAGLGNVLLQSGLRKTLVLDFTHIPQEDAILKIKNRNARNSATVNTDENMYVDSDIEENLSEGRNLMRHIVHTGDHTYKVSCELFLYSRDLEELHDTTTSTLSALANVPGNPFRVIDSGVLEPWLDCAPFSGRQFCEQVELVETNAVHLFPLSSSWRGSDKPVALYHTRSGALVSLDSFDPRNKNWHTLYLGESGSGKTFAAQYQMSEALKDEKIEGIVIDRGLSWANVVKAYEGVIINVEPGGDTAINPFQLEEGQLAPTEAKKAMLLNILKAMCPSDGGATEADETAIFAAAIEEVYDAYCTELKDETTGEYYKTLEVFTLSDYIRTMLNLSAIGNRRVTDYDKQIASGLARRLQVWTGDSPLGRFIDRPTTLPTSMAKIVLYETSAFDAMPMLDAVGTMLIQAEIWQRARGNVDKKLILAIDEAWAVTQNPYSLKLTMEIARRGRKEGIAMWLLTHSLKDLVGEGKESLLGAFQSYFLVRLSSEHDLLKTYLHLSDDHLEVFRSLTARKNDYNELLYLTRRDSGVEAEVLVLRPSSADYWMFTNHSDDLAVIANKEKELGSRDNAIRVLAGMETR